jgi:hypothetical protein
MDSIGQDITEIMEGNMLPIFNTLRPGQQVQVEYGNTDDLRVINSGAEFEGEHLNYLWFELEEREAGQTYHTYKAIQLRALTHIPVKARDDPDILGKMVTVLRGLYNARVDFIHLHAGIFDEPALGIVQVYGIVGVSDSRSVSDGISHVESSSHGVSRSASVAQARTYALSEMASFSVGGVPSVSLSKSFQWEDDVAIRLTELLRQQEVLLDQMSKEGGYLTDVYVLTRTQGGKRAAQALVPQAFHGVDEVVTPVLTRELDRAEERHLRLHAACFTPCAAEETVPGVMSGYRHASLLTMLQVAAYAAPGVFEEGVALTTQESIPSFAFLPDMDGDVVLGHLVSTETGDLTAAQVRLSPERMFHTVFAGNTGYGKSVAAERLALETTARWHYRSIVLDFGQGWRKMLTAPGLDGHVEIYQLQPGAMRPLRWNPLQFGKRIDPEQQLRAICDLWANAGGMGPRQLGFMRRALIELYLEHGALTADRQTLGDERWNTVRNQYEEEAIVRRLKELNLPVRPLIGTHLGALTAVERQALAVYRSRWVDIPGWYDRLRWMYDDLKPSQTVDRTSLEGVLLHLEPFSRGEMAMMYGRGEDMMTIEDVSLPWGMTVFEGGAELDEYAKVALLR